jgi:hypothetical protein
VCVAAKPVVQAGARKKKTQAELRADKAARLAAERAAAAEADAALRDPSKVPILYSRFLAAAARRRRHRPRRHHHRCRRARVPTLIVVLDILMIVY